MRSGHLILAEADGSSNDEGAPGFTLIELLVVVAIVAILAGLLFPVFARAKTACYSARCASNLRQIGIAVKAYCNDHNDRMPVIDTMFEMNANRVSGYNPLADANVRSPMKVMGAYLKDERILVCPAAVNGLPFGAGNVAWRQTYVFYGRDYEKVRFGYLTGRWGWDQFNGQVQQTTTRHGTDDPVVQAIWVRDSILRDPAHPETPRLPHGNTGLLRLYADGRVRRDSPETHAVTGDF